MFNAVNAPYKLMAAVLVTALAACASPRGACTPDRRCGDEWTLALSTADVTVRPGDTVALSVLTERDEGVPRTTLPRAQRVALSFVRTFDGTNPAAPAGVSASFNPDPVGVPGTSVLTISASATVPPGTYGASVLGRDEFDIVMGAGLRVTVSP